MTEQRRTIGMLAFVIVLLLAAMLVGWRPY
jgi:hypothetical protein